MKRFAQLLVCIVALHCSNGQTVDPTDRIADPVVLKGADLPEVVGQKPDHIIGFKYDSNLDTMIQIPIQIDEMVVQKWNNIKDDDCFTQGHNTSFLVYADYHTFTGRDTDTMFDNDDELVFMARDVGPMDTVNHGTNFGNGDFVSFIPPAEVEVFDPVLGVVHGYVYLYICVQSCKYEPGAGTSYVDYQFNLTTKDSLGSNQYFDVYEIHCDQPDGRYECDEDDTGPKNPEDTWVKTPWYERHWAQNWHSDDLKIHVGGSTGVDILSIQEFQFTMTDCGRCTESFMDGQTAFIANKNGPVRGIRAWVGANSGAVTQRQHLLYDQRDDQVTYLRVHPIPGAMDYIVYEPNTYMTYYNCYHDTRATGIPIDGVDDGLQTNATMCEWEAATGEAGTFFRALNLEHTLHHNSTWPADAFFKHWFYDNASPTNPTGGSHGTPIYDVDGREFHMCATTTSKQVEAWGTHGVILNHPEQLAIANTCPLRNEFHYRDASEYPVTACLPEVPQPDLYQFDYYSTQYYLERDWDPAKGKGYYNSATYGLFRSN